MAYIRKMDLRLFGDGGAAGASAAPAAGAGEGGEAAVVAPGVLEDGTKVDARLAARMEAQARRRKNRGEEPVRPAAPAANKTQLAQPQAEVQPAAEPEEPSLDDQWTEVRKKFKDQIGRDIKAAVDDRFKNQKDANETLATLGPALNILSRQRGIEEGDYKALAESIEKDDSLIEEQAEKAGLTVEAFRTQQQLIEENRRYHEREAQEQEELFLREHFTNLAQQAEELKKIYPDFDLRTEMQNETFRRLTMPNSGCTLEAAYYAVHHKDLEAQAMAYGIQRTQQQISQTLQANRQLPVEGAMKTGQPADIAIDPRKMTREQRQSLIERARRGERIQF